MSTTEINDEVVTIEPDRYAEVEIDGAVVIYDRENPDAWIQSHYAVEVGEC